MSGFGCGVSGLLESVSSEFYHLSDSHSLRPDCSKGSRFCLWKNPPAVKIDTKEKETEKISPDQYIKDIELIGNKLKKGKHKAVAYVKAYDKKTDELVGEVQVDMIITSK